MKRLAYIVASGVLAVAGFAPAVALAANDVTFSAETTITLSGGTLYVESGATVDSFVNNGNNLAITISSGSSITLRSDARSAFSVSPNVATHVCETNSSKLTLTGTATTQTITVGLVQDASCPAGGGGGGGGSGDSPSSTSSSGTTSGGSSGSSGTTAVSTAPTGGTITIAGGAGETSSTQVTLTLSASGATQMQVSNTSAFSDGSGWVAYATSLPWTLPSGVGSKTVYARFRSSGGVDSAAVSDSITLVASSASTPVPAPSAASTVALKKVAGSSAVYAVQNGVRRLIRNADIFLAHGFSWGAVATVGSLADVPLSDPLDYPVVPGMLIKGSGSKVYLVEGGTRRWITSESVFLGLGYAWSAIRVVQEATLAGLPEGAAISAAAAHPDGTLIKYATSPRVYLLEGGKKRWIPSAEVFTQRNLRWENIVTIPASFSYPDGSDLTGSGKVLGVSTGPTTSETFTEDLAPGDRSETVRTLQSLLILRGYLATDVVPTGFYGAATRAAVQRFQQAHGISATGTVGPQTRASLNLHP